MPLATASKNVALDALDEAQAAGLKYAALHTGDPSGGSNEVAGGSPAYARQAVTFAAAASGSKALNGTLPTFDVPAGTTVRWLGYWSAVSAGSILAWAPLGGGALKPFSVDDAATDTLDSAAHGFSDGDTVVVWGSALPTGLAQYTVYYVITSATNTLKLSATSGGSAVDLTAVGMGHLQKIVPESFGAQGTYTLSSGSVDLNGIV